MTYLCLLGNSFGAKAISHRRTTLRETLSQVGHPLAFDTALRQTGRVILVLCRKLTSKVPLSLYDILMGY
jgi:hypothetical protein